MKLSSNTIKVLQNFAGINQNIVVNKDAGVLKTVSEAKNIMACAKIEDTIGATFGIYDLNEFLSAINLVSNPDFTFSDSYIEVNSENAKHGIRYFCANPEILTYPKKDITNPAYEVALKLSQDNINAIKKAASVFGFETVSLTKQSDSSDIVAKVIDANNKSSNAYRLIVGTLDDASSFSFDFMINNLKLLPGDYTLSLSSKFISRWESEFTPAVTYWVALESTSTYSK